MDGYIAEIRLFAGNFAPRNWAFCEGQLQAIAQNTALFSIVGTYYGGDGRTTFGLPDFKGRAAIGVGNGPGLPPAQIGQKGGVERHALTTATMPNHSHTIAVSGSVNLQANAGTPSDTDDPSGAFFQTQAEDYYAESPNAVSGPLNSDLSAVLGNTGNGVAFSNQQPFLALRYIICLVGRYPSRS